jgi:hypothetical protein
VSFRGVLFQYEVKKMGKQIRVSEAQYKSLVKMADELEINRTEMLNNMLGIIQKIIDHRAVSIKIINKDGAERELFLSFLGSDNEK